MRGLNTWKKASRDVFNLPWRKYRLPLPALLDGQYPIVLTHSDLNEIDILVNPDSGEITGVVDWPGASFLPFGFTLYVLENALGGMGPKGWEWFDDADNLRVAFWVLFREKTGLSEAQIEPIMVAARAGILLRYGTAYNSGFEGMIGTRDPDDEDYRCLDALLRVTII